jgi:hybrid polyketide synthase/nonribosomal peptide synthetase ACE1
MPVARLALMVENAQPSAILVHAGTAELVGGLGLHQDSLLINVSELDTSSPGLAIPTCAASNRPAVIFHTSGSTGRPKGIIINHASLQNTIEHSTRRWNLKAEDVILQQSASTFDLSLGQVFQALSVGATLCIASKSMRMDSRAIVDYMFRESVSLTLATPTEYRSWLQWGCDSQLARSPWKVALTAGESVTETLLGLFRELDKCDLQLYNLYGPTETTLWSTQMKLDYHATDTYLDSVPVGSVCPNEHLYILDAKLRPQPVGIPGEVVIGGLGVAAGYLNLDPEAEASFIPDLVTSGTNRMYRTRDLGRLLPNGDLVILGRIDDDTEVKLQGVRIDLREIEQTILRIGHNSLVNVAVSLRSASGGTHRFLVAHVVPNPTERERVQDPSTLELLRTRLPLPAVMRPSIIVAVDCLPQTVSAKLDRKALDKLAIPPHLLEQKESEECFSIPVQEMKSLWETVIPDDLLMYHHVHAESDFFHVGGNSMLLIDLHTRICEKYHTSITLFQLFQSSTLQGMAQLVQRPSITRQGQPSVHIDWDVETTPSPSLAAQFSAIASQPVHSPPRTVILTGATGFLGQHLLRVLTAHPHIRKIICLAVRNLEGARRVLLNSIDKVDILEGDLTQSNVGVPASVLHYAFEQADAVIHNGADISQTKTYRSIRPANFSSTQTIISLCSARRIPIHYISTAAISILSSLDVFPETAAQASPPPVDGSLGYIASKWASEKYLERVCNIHPDLPVWIYRPSAIIRDQDSSSDFTHSLIGFSRRLRAVPNLSSMHGYLDFVSIESATAVIMRELLASQPNPTPGPSYHHLTGDSVLPLNELRERLAVEVGGNFDVLPLPVWITRARDIGLSRGMAAVFEGLEHSALQLPRLERGKPRSQLWV